MLSEMTRLAEQLPEYDTVRAMHGVGDKTAPQLMAEIGDVRRFPRRSSIVGFAGVDPAIDESGKHISKSNPTPSAALLICAKRSARLSAPTSRSRPQTSLCASFWARSALMESRITST